MEKIIDDYGLIAYQFKSSSANFAWIDSPREVFRERGLIREDPSSGATWQTSATECSICGEPYNDHDHFPARFNDPTCSKHVYGRSCIREWLRTANSCPHCRTLLFGNTRSVNLDLLRPSPAGLRRIYSDIRSLRLHWAELQDMETKPLPARNVKFCPFFILDIDGIWTDRFIDTMVEYSWAKCWDLIARVEPADRKKVVEQFQSNDGLAFLENEYKPECIKAYARLEQSLLKTQANILASDVLSMRESPYPVIGQGSKSLCRQIMKRACEKSRQPTIQTSP